MTKLKLVKMAHIETEKDLIKVKHYETFIIEYNTKTEIAHVLMGLSPISNTQIKYFIEAFNPKKIIDDNKDFKKYAKNEFSRPLEN